MSRFYGEIGYAETVETSPGVYQELIVERNYYGDMLKNISRTRVSDNLNDNIIVDNRLSIVADPYAYEKFYLINYVKWMGIKWKVISVDVQRPRLIIVLGGVYNEQTNGSTQGSC